MSKKQIPNVLSIIRMFLVPTFILVYFSENENARLYALAIFIIAEITDVIDGFLARRYNWITQLGKILDPLADKMMQAAAIICLSLSNSVFIWIAAVFVIRECFMFIGAYIVLKKRRDIVASNYYGKFSSAFFAAVVMVFIIYPDNITLMIILSVLLAIVLLFALLMYYLTVFRGKYGIKPAKKRK